MLETETGTITGFRVQLLGEWEIGKGSRGGNTYWVLQIDIAIDVAVDRYRYGYRYRVQVSSGLQGFWQTGCKQT